MGMKDGRRIDHKNRICVKVQPEMISERVSVMSVRESLSADIDIKSVTICPRMVIGDNLLHTPGGGM